ncbi:MAG: hypothetical protein CMM84_18845 [Rhodothermaceae bacterium]|nr:hypothetical protein [Rhodothermaceae bacterium]MBC13316.1 hypothetical protein [Rhodothermaceae bacterium]MBC15036.1 hypothetical protein [Rhodothermaceae bacterium]MBC15381.1 hypothetical protein [Rhodothermaceae bacterium]
MNATSPALNHTASLTIPTREGGGVYRSEDAPIQRLAGDLATWLKEAEPQTVVRVRLDAPLSASAHARVLGPALRMVAGGECPGRYVVVEDPARENDYDAEAALEKESKTAKLKLVCVWREPNQPARLIGAVDAAVEQTYALTRDRWALGQSTTARDLAEAIGASIQSASNRMAKAAQLGVLCQVDESSPDGGGVQRVFVPIE